MSKSRLIMCALAIAGLGAVALGYAAPQVAKVWLPNSDRNALAQLAPVGSQPAAAETAARADTPSTQVETRRDVRVDAPHTAVRVDKDNGKVAVKAPYTDVKVDPDKGQVRVRTPYVNLDIRW